MRIKTMLSAGAAAIALTAALAGCSTDATTTTSGSTTSAAASPASAKLSGTFSGLNGKKVSGTVTISGDTVKLTGYSSDQGPDLHLYLTNGTTEADVTAGKEFSAVAYNQATQTFTLPAGVDASSYKDLVVHCDKALAVFGSASLSK